MGRAVLTQIRAEQIQAGEIPEDDARGADRLAGERRALPEPPPPCSRYYAPWLLYVVGWGRAVGPRAEEVTKAVLAAHGYHRYPGRSNPRERGRPTTWSSSARWARNCLSGPAGGPPPLVGHSADRGRDSGTCHDVLKDRRQVRDTLAQWMPGSGNSATPSRRAPRPGWTPQVRLSVGRCGAPVERVRVTVCFQRVEQPPRSPATCPAPSVCPPLSCGIASSLPQKPTAARRGRAQRRGLDDLRRTTGTPSRSD